MPPLSKAVRRVCLSGYRHLSKPCLVTPFAWSKQRPGSGKTRALVARFLQTAAAQHRGVALLSFTNAAVDEVRRRTGGSAQALKAPHFVGTIDSFLHRFIVTPAEVLRLRRTPTYLASWSTLVRGVVAPERP